MTSCDLLLRLVLISFQLSVLKAAPWISPTSCIKEVSVRMIHVQNVSSAEEGHRSEVQSRTGRESP